MKYRRPVVVKADGLAAGKGVFVCSNRDQALGALDECMVNRTFDSAGDVVVFEEWLEGQEVSVFAFTDGEHVSSLTAACDYKRIEDGDQGPNTGGMGAYSPPEFWNADMEDTIRRQIMEPVVRAMALEGIPYQGVLYAGLMLTKEGPKVLEFNCRLGDPEAQVILPRLVTDPVDVMLACIEGTQWTGCHWNGPNPPQLAWSRLPEAIPASTRQATPCGVWTQWTMTHWCSRAAPRPWTAHTDPSL